MGFYIYMSLKLGKYIKEVLSLGFEYLNRKVLGKLISGKYFKFW